MSGQRSAFTPARRCAWDAPPPAKQPRAVGLLPLLCRSDAPLAINQPEDDLDHGSSR